MSAQELLKQARIESGLSQRALADLAGTSGPTVAAYEVGAKEPLFSTLQRLLGAAGSALEAVPAGAAKDRARRQRRSLALAAATAAAIESDPGAARSLASKNLRRMTAAVGDNTARRWLDAWAEVIEGPVEEIRDTLLDPSQHGDDMRQMTPFAGLLSEEERRSVLAAVDVLVPR